MKRTTLTLNKALKKGEEILKRSNVPNSGLDAFTLLSFVTGVTRAKYYLDPDKELSPLEEKNYLEAIEMRERRIPLQHITKEQEFMGYSFKVSDKVLIPRQDTEVLVEEAVSQIKKKDRVLDMCTGSGCIIISMYKILEEKERYEGQNFTAVDISTDALDIAKENARRLEAKVTFIVSDLFERVPDKYDMIVSNPPYIKSKEIKVLEDEVKLYDPVLALDGGVDGLDFYRRIIREGKEHLHNGGRLLLEIGCDEGKEVKELMEEAQYKEVYIKKDLSGLDRIVCGRLQ